MGRSDALIEFGIALPIALLVATGIAWVVQRVFRRRLSLPLSVMILEPCPAATAGRRG